MNQAFLDECLHTFKLLGFGVLFLWAIETAWIILTYQWGAENKTEE